MPFLDTDGVRLYVQVVGDKGLPIIFVNGWAATCRMWSPLVERLSKLHRCVLYDPRGTGRSLATTLGVSFEVEDAVADLHAVLRYVSGWDAHVVGQGIGAVVGLLAARERPQNFSSLTLIGTECPPPPSGSDREVETDLLLMQARILLQEAATIPYVRQLLLWRYRRVPEPYRTDLYEDFAATDPRAAYGLARSVRDVVIRTRFWDALRHVPLPILLVRGAFDDVLPSTVHRAMFDRIQRGQTATVRDAGHLPTLEYPDECAALLVNFFRTESLPAYRP
ncbi:MAG: alpha/beta hydrolase [Chloracidobacterium sp.]|nr:alpha/beta hydrolase [Chloracidobacterium sp.]MDW8217197.1 alpha/beta hydrolase [Acidobacteriota bacterium]